MKRQLVPMSDIVIGDRTRKEFRGIDKLAESMARVGMLNPITVDDSLNLVAGGRRLKAAQLLGWDEVPVNKVSALSDAVLALVAERDENECRDPLTVSEMVELGKRLESLEKPAAEAREKAGIPCGKFPQGRVRDTVGNAVGVSGKTYDKAKKIIADGDKSLVDAVDAGEVSIDAAAKVARLPKAQQRAAVKGGPAKVKAAAKKATSERNGKHEPAVVPPTLTDAWGIPIQEHAAEAFAAVPKFKELAAAIAHAQRLFNECANLPGGKFLTLPDVSSYRRGKKGDDGEHADRFVHEGLETALRQVKAAIPTHTVCPLNYIEGKHPKDCPTCRGLNWTPVLSGNTPKAAEERAKEAFGV